MPTIAVAALKGGVGKTTLALHLAEYLESSGSTVTVVDADRQASATSWSRLASERGEPLRCSIKLGASAAVGQAITEEWAPESDYVIVDLGPGDAQVMGAAIEVADLVVIPCGAREADLVQVGPVIEGAKLGQVPAVVVLSRVRAGTRAPVEVREALAADGVEVLEEVVPELERIGAVFGLRPEAADWPPFDTIAADLLGRIS